MLKYGCFLTYYPYLCTVKRHYQLWSVRLTVRTLGFHPRNGSSILPRTTKKYYSQRESFKETSTQCKENSFTFILC